MADKKRSASDEAARYLTYSMRTVSQMRDHLQKKGYTREEIDEAIEELEVRGYLDDYKYALMYAGYGYDRERGGIRIRRELMDKGIASDVAGNAIEDYRYQNGIDEYVMALSIAERMIERFTGGPGLDGKADPDEEFEGSESSAIGEKELAKIARKLDNLGYRKGDIIKVISEIRGGY